MLLREDFRKACTIYGSSTVPDGTFRYTYRPRIWRTPYAISAIPSATAESLPTKDGAGFSRSSLVTVISASFSKDFALIPETILMNPTAIESQFSIGVSKHEYRNTAISDNGPVRLSSLAFFRNRHISCNKKYPLN